MYVVDVVDLGGGRTVGELLFGGANPKKEEADFLAARVS